MSIFKTGVSRKSEQLRKVLLTLDKLLADTKDCKDLASFGRKYPAHLDTIKSDLKQARQLLYGVVEKLNFPKDKWTGVPVSRGQSPRLIHRRTTQPPDS